MMAMMMLTNRGFSWSPFSSNAHSVTQHEQRELQIMERIQFHEQLK